jgi:hypothetical protein
MLPQPIFTLIFFIPIDLGQQVPQHDVTSTFTTFVYCTLVFAKAISTSEFDFAHH